MLWFWYVDLNCFHVQLQVYVLWELSIAHTGLGSLYRNHQLDKKYKNDDKHCFPKQVDICSWNEHHDQTSLLDEHLWFEHFTTTEATWFDLFSSNHDHKKLKDSRCCCCMVCILWCVFVYPWQKNDKNVSFPARPPWGTTRVDAPPVPAEEVLMENHVYTAGNVNNVMYKHHRKHSLTAVSATFFIRHPTWTSTTTVLTLQIWNNFSIMFHLWHVHVDRVCMNTARVSKVSHTLRRC